MTPGPPPPPRWDLEKAADLCLALQAVPAPTFAEAERAAVVAERLGWIGLDARIEATGPNVVARVPGRAPGPGLMVSAHLDTVFPAGTDLSARREGLRLAGPGMGDNTLGLTGLLLLAEALRGAGLAPARDVWLVANAAEEGLGDLRGMRAALDGLGESVAACVVLEGSKRGAWPVTHRGLGSRRYRVWAAAPGGHSWGDFGQPSAVHLLLPLAAEIVASIPLPRSPRCSFNIGEVRGGHSVNSLAESAELLLDLRSEDPPSLAGLAAWVEALVARHSGRLAEATGARIGLEQVGDRPAGGLAEDHPLVDLAVAALRRAGAAQAEIALRVSSTDANLPLARGIPAVTVHLAEGGDAHRLDEWVDLTQLGMGMDQVWWLVGSAAEAIGSGRLARSGQADGGVWRGAAKKEGAGEGALFET